MRTGSRYLAIAEDLRRRIAAGAFDAAGGRLDAERALVAHYDASRTTIRTALELLETDGLITRRRGRGGGTFVRSTPPRVELATMVGFMPQLRAHGLSVSSTLVAATLESADALQAAELHVTLRAPLFRIERLRSVDGVPVLLEESFFPAADFPGLLDADLTGSLYELLDANYGRAPVRKREILSPARPTPHQRGLLRAGRDELVLRISRTAVDAQGRPVEFSHDVLRTEIAQLSTTTA